MGSVVYWRKPLKGRCYGVSIKKAMERGFVSVILADKLKKLDLKADLPESDQDVFDNRFYLITKDNLDQLDPPPKK